MKNRYSLREVCTLRFRNGLIAQNIYLLRGILRSIRQGWTPAFTPDGPRGPKYSVDPGVAMIAARSGLPLYPIGLAVDGAWVLKSWDAFVIPKPFARVAIHLDDAIRASDFADRDEFCRALADGLHAATQKARRALRKG